MEFLEERCSVSIFVGLITILAAQVNTRWSTQCFRRACTTQ